MDMPKILLKKHLGPQTLKITQIIHLGSFIFKKKTILMQKLICIIFQFLVRERSHRIPSMKEKVIVQVIFNHQNGFFFCFMGSMR
jgi:hypothetical protein